MIAADTSSLVAYLQGLNGDDVEALDQALETKQLSLPPAVITEIMSDPKVPAAVLDLLKSLPALEVTEGYWERAGLSRSRVLAKKQKARVADALIAQICIDHKASLISRDRDFHAFAKICGLKLV
jgi:predicted nucleic acid-binding protein